MATINAVILKHQQKKDGTWNVKICVNHKSTPRYIETNNYVSKENLDSKGRLKKVYIDRFLAKTLTGYRDRISLIGSRIQFMDSIDIKNYLLSSENSNQVIDVIDNFKQRVKVLKEANKHSNSIGLDSVCVHLLNFTNSDNLNAISVNSNFLKEFEYYLINNAKVTKNTARTYMSIFGKEFKFLVKKYNNPATDSFPIPYNPFEYYTPIRKIVTKKRNLDIDKIVKISLFKTDSTTEKLTIDIFMLSFYLCGMNPKDIYVHLTNPNIKGILEYGRSKIKERRSDGGVTNVLIPVEAEILIQKYAGLIQKRYSSVVIFHKTFYRAWKSINAKMGFKCTMYYARHSFGNIARQVCKFSKDDVSFALNHKYGSDITDVYIDPDWSVVHKVQMGVIEEFRKALKKE